MQKLTYAKSRSLDERTEAVACAKGDSLVLEGSHVLEKSIVLKGTLVLPRKADCRVTRTDCGA